MAITDSDLPTFDNCDPNDPEEKFLPVFTAPPDFGGVLYPIPLALCKKLSTRMDALGIDYVRDPSIKFRANPEAMTPFDITGKWVDVDTPDSDDDAVREQMAKIKPAVIRAVAKAALDDDEDLRAEVLRKYIDEEMSK